MLFLAFIIALYILVMVTDTEAGKPKTNSDKTSNADPLAGVEGLKAKFGDKLVDLDNIRLHKPHSVKPNLHLRDTRPTGTTNEQGNAGGLLQTGDHRPKLE